MISSCIATGGYAAELPALKGRRFELGPGLTVLFGHNGSGKSTILKMIAAGSSIATTGWTRFSSSFVGESEPFPDRFRKGMRHAPIGDVDWDGTPTFLSEGPPVRSQATFDIAVETSAEETAAFLFGGKVSSGQEQILWLEKMEKTLGSPPDVITPNERLHVPGYGWICESKVNDVWERTITEFRDFIRSRPRTGPVTALFDEPDAHMSIPNQHALWTKVMGRIATGRQVIVATHSAFALLAEGATLIDLKPGYIDRCREVLSAFGKDTGR